jgi:hypothetical protein
MKNNEIFSRTLNILPRASGWPQAGVGDPYSRYVYRMTWVEQEGIEHITSAGKSSGMLLFGRPRRLGVVGMEVSQDSLK